MADTTTPESPEVAQQSAEQKLDAILFGDDADGDSGQERTEGDEPTPDVPADELSPDDIEAQPEDDGESLELNHNGEIKRVSKEEARKLAQMGLDATQKWQAAAETQKQNNEMRQAMQARLQLHPQIIDAAATLKSYDAALRQYQNTDWVRLSQDDPIGYSQARAQFDQLRDGYGQASATFQQVAQRAQHIESQIDAGVVHAQSMRVLEALPEWKDPQRRAADQGRIRQYLASEGIDDGEMNTIVDARHLIIARKAMLYDQAMKAKKGSPKQNAPASLRPGPAPSRGNQQTLKAETIKQLHQARDPDRRKALFDKALEQKLGL
jgi:hypothetical protein